MQTKRQLLDLLKRCGPQSVKALADALELTPMGIRGHLVTLERDGLVASSFVRQKVGRPAQIFALTLAADRHFPSTSSALAIELLKELRELDGPEKISGLFARRQALLKKLYGRRLAGKSFADQVAELAHIRDEEGYVCRSEVKSRRSFELVERHCPIADIAREFPQACEFEKKLFESALGVPLTRTEHLMSGGLCCRYCIHSR